MKKGIVFCSIILLCFCLCLLGFTIVEASKYKNFNKKSRISELNKQIDEIDKMLKVKEEEKNVLEENNSYKINLLEMWKCEAKKVTQNS